MTRKILLLGLVFAMVFSLIACGEENPQVGTTEDEKQQSSEETHEKETQETVNGEIVLNQSMKFMGYMISYPGEGPSNVSNYGKIVGTQSYCFVIEAPSIAGKMHDVHDLADAPAVCEEYITDTLEHTMRSKFDPDSTTQNITASSKVNYNGVDMLLVEGTFVNDLDGYTKEYAAIYLLAGENGNLPAYIVGLPMEEGYDIVAIVAEIAKNITK